MNTPFYLEALYLDIAAHLTSPESIAFLAAYDLPAVAHVDLFLGQYDSEENQIAYATPAVFIEFAESQYTERGRLQEAGLETIRIHIEQRQVGSTAYNSHNRPQSLQTLRFIEAIHVLLKGFEGDFYGKFRRVARASELTTTNHPVHIFDYTTQATYEATDKYRNYTQTNPNETALKVSKS
jgi:hypothetical protein